MAFVIELLKPHLTKGLLVFSLLFWALFATFEALSKKTTTLLIAIDSNGTRVIRTQDDPIFKTEIVQFLRFYLEKAYNFTPQNFSQNVGEATTLMSESLWKQEGENISRLKNMVEDSGLAQLARVERISQISSTHFQSILQIEQKSRLNTQSFKIKVSLQIQNIKRNESNPWGIEVLELKEERL